MRLGCGRKFGLSALHRVGSSYFMTRSQPQLRINLAHRCQPCDVASSRSGASSSSTGRRARTACRSSGPRPAASAATRTRSACEVVQPQTRRAATARRTAAAPAAGTCQCNPRRTGSSALPPRPAEEATRGCGWPGRPACAARRCAGYRGRSCTDGKGQLRTRIRTRGQQIQQIRVSSHSG